MHISWLGNTGIRIQTRPHEEDITVIIDPYKQVEGVYPRSLSPHIALLTHGQEEQITLSGDPFILSTPGECEVKGVLISAVANSDGSNVFFRIDSESLSLAHLGSAQKPLSDDEIGVLSGVDILFVPVGGSSCYNAEEAVKAVNIIEPRIVIPILHQSDNNPNALPVTAFIKAIGVAPQNEDKKVIIKKKDLPEEEMKVIVLGKE